MVKSAGEFADQTKTFEVAHEKAEIPSENEKKIVLNIADLAEEKRLIAKAQTLKFQMTGNPIVDAFRRINTFFVEHASIKTQDLANFFRLLATMINAGMPLMKSLDSLAAQSDKIPKLRLVLENVSRKVEEGESLSNALKSHSDVFSEAQIGMIAAGEASGQLNEVLTDLATEVEKSAGIKRKIKGAMTYPIVIMTILIGVIFLMMLKVIPKITDLFSQAGSELPALTRGMIGMSDFMNNHFVLIMLGIVGIVAGFILWKKTPTGHYGWDGIKMKIPVFGRLIKQGILARFSRLFSNLMTSGVPLVQALTILSEAIGNEVYKERILLAVEDIKQGIPLAENLMNSPLFPDMLVNMVEVGEKTAALEQVMDKLADFYEDEVDVAVKSLTKAFEPIILVIIGGTVGLLVAAIMLPIIQLTNVSVG